MHTIAILGNEGKSQRDNSLLSQTPKHDVLFHAIPREKKLLEEVVMMDKKKTKNVLIIFEFTKH